MRRKRRAIWIACAVALALAAPAASATAAPLRGQRDRSFGNNGKVLFKFGPTYAHSAYTQALTQPDGSLLVGGTTETDQGPYREEGGMVQRLLPSGALDPGFGPATGAGTFAGLALQPNGDVLYALAQDYYGSVHRLLPNGTPDPAFGTGGESGRLPLAPQLITLDSAGRVVVVGTVNVAFDKTLGPTAELAVTRLLPDGTLDKSFGSEGLTLLEPLSRWSGDATGLATGPDGSIVIAGASALFGLTVAGVPDPAFGVGGQLPIEGGTAAMVKASNGDLVVAGPTTRSCCGTGKATAVRAYHATDGSPDEAWGDAGTAVIQVADYDSPVALAPSPEGGVLLAGVAAKANGRKRCAKCNFKPFVARLSATGDLDPGFSSRPPGRVETVAATADGGALVAGTTGKAIEQAAVTALGPDGTPERSFGAGGTAVHVETRSSRTSLSGLAVEPGGSIVAAYSSDAGAYEEHSAFTSWSAAGARRGDIPSAELTYAFPFGAFERDGRGRLYQVGQSPDQVSRFSPKGRLDHGYGANGEAPLPEGFELEQLIVRRSGAALAIGHVEGERPMALFELTPRGRPDRGFGHRGLAEVPWGEAAGLALSATFDRRGRIVVFGLFLNGNPFFPKAALARLHSDGHLDRGFGQGGRQMQLPEMKFDESSVALGSDGAIYVGSSTLRGGPTTLLRFREDGSRDRSFGHDGIVRTERQRPLLALFADGGRLLVFSGTDQSTRSGLAIHAFDRGGRPDRAFGDHGALEVDGDQADGFGPQLAVGQPDGRIVVAGTRGSPLPGKEIELLRFR